MLAGCFYYVAILCHCVFAAHSRSNSLIYSIDVAHNIGSLVIYFSYSFDNHPYMVLEDALELII